MQNNVPYSKLSFFIDCDSLHHITCLFKIINFCYQKQPSYIQNSKYGFIKFMILITKSYLFKRIQLSLIFLKNTDLMEFVIDQLVVVYSLLYDYTQNYHEVGSLQCCCFYSAYVLPWFL